MGSGGVKPAAAMVAVEFIFSALQIFIKLALDDGMDVRVLVAYRLMFGTAFLCPLAFFFERYVRCRAEFTQFSRQKQILIINRMTVQTPERAQLLTTHQQFNMGTT
jgi:hypothetical protein